MPPEQQAQYECCYVFKLNVSSNFNASKTRKAIPKTTKGKGRNYRTVKEGAGMTAKGVAAHRRKIPKSKLKTAVTKKEKNLTAKEKARKKSFALGLEAGQVNVAKLS